MSQSMQRRDKLIPWYFVMFFVFIALVNAVMVTLAVRTHTGIVTEHPYEKGLAYNRVIAAEEKQEALGWKGSIAYADGMLRFSLHDKTQAPIVLDTASAKFTRPTQAGMDFSVELKDNKAHIDFPAKGLWEVRVEAMAQGQYYQQAKRIVIE